jgi:hypothetical protein
MVSSHFLAVAVVALMPAGANGAFAQDPVKLGFIPPMTGQQQSTGKQEAVAIKLCMAQQGDTVAGKKIELIIRDDAAVPDNTKRIAQELFGDDKVTFLAGFGVTPAATIEAARAGNAGKGFAVVLAEILKGEPPMGQLREGQTVLVDDGSCPVGQIKQVIGGNHVRVGGTKHIVRTYKCIPK